MLLEIKNLSVSLADKTLLDDINMSIDFGERHLLSGRNGSGKSTLAQVIAGNPEYIVDSGTITFDGRDITTENPTTRSLMGIFLGAQNVPEIPGLTVISFLKHSCAAHTNFSTGKELSMGDFLKNLESAREQLEIPSSWMNRSVNLGFSGGERKRLMLLRLLMISPKLAILDEPDSGADASVQQAIVSTMEHMKQTAFLFISHQEKFTKLAAPKKTTCLSFGKIVIE